MSDSSSVTNSCPKCGAALPSQATAGLCPRCLMAEAMAPTHPDSGPAAPQKALTPEELAPHFPQLEIIESLGRGGMGVVYKARQKSLNRFVALKLLAPERVGDAGFAERFQKEAQALAALNHPHIVTVHDFGQAGGFYYLLMEFVDGVNLRQAMKAGRFTPEQALAVVPPVCEALQYAHNHGIVHRDIKPENLLLDREGRVMIADFGIAKMLGAGASGVGLAESQPAGTPQYMAPEQQTAPQRADNRADIYSLGVVLYEMLTGELPGKPLEPPSRKVQIDVRLDAVVLRALEKNPELRYQQVSEVKTMVETIATTPPPASPPATPPGTDGSPVREQPSTQPRFSRTAIVGAFWVPFFFGAAVFLAMERPAGFQRYSFVATMLVFLSLAACFGTTILGGVAVSQIRRSAGTLSGMWLAVFDGLLFPLLAMNGLVIGGLIFGFRVIGPPATPVPFWLLLFITILELCLLALLFLGNFFIVRWAWRAANKPMGGSTPVPANGRPPNPKATEPGAAKALRPALLTVAWHAGLLLATFGFLVSVVPRFSAMFKDLDVALPALTVLTLTLSEAMRHGGFLLFPVLLALDAGICILTQYLGGRWLRHVWSALVGCGCGVIVLVAGVSLYWPISSLARQVSPTTATGRQKLSFGQVIERVVNHTGSNCFIDLDTGEVRTPPKEVFAQGSQAAMRWTEQHGIDAGGFVADPGRGLIGFDMVAVPVSDKSWSGIQVYSLQEMVASSKPGNPVYLSAGPTLPTTFLFATREGGMGVLQITGFTDNPPGVKIRYKLVQEPAAWRHAAPSPALASQPTETARLKLEYAEKELTRAEELRRQNAISAEDYEKARFDRDLALAALAGDARKALQLKLAFAETQLTRIKALYAKRLIGRDEYDRAEHARDLALAELAGRPEIEGVARPRTLKAYFLSGHGEPDPHSTDQAIGYSKFAAMLREGCDIPFERLSLVNRAEVPTNCSLLVVAGPTDPYSNQDLEKLRKYLDQGGRMLALFNWYSVGKPTGLEKLLAQYDVEVGTNLVVDIENSPNRSGKEIVPTDLGSHAIVARLHNSRVCLSMPRTIRKSRNPSARSASTKVDELLFTGPNSIVVTDVRKGMPQVNPNLDQRGSVPLMVAVERGAVPGVSAERGATRLVVIGDSFFLQNDGIESVANRDFGAQVVIWLVD